MRWNCISKALCFPEMTVKTSSKNFSITLLQISLKLHKQRGDHWMKKFLWTILEEQFPVWRNTAASKIGNGTISLLIFQNLCQWRNSLCANLEGISPGKPYPATLNFIFLCFKVIIIHYHTPKQKKIIFKPRIKLNHNIYTCNLPIEQQELQSPFWKPWGNGSGLVLSPPPSKQYKMECTCGENQS